MIDVSQGLNYISAYLFINNLFNFCKKIEEKTDGKNR